MKSFSKDIAHYLVLFGVLLAGFTGIVLFPYDKGFQVGVCLATVGGYVSWGIVHHYLHDDLHPETVVEYMAVAVMGLIILLALI